MVSFLILLLVPLPRCAFNSYDDLFYNHDGQPSFKEALMTTALDRA
jgi:hypothetical protein